MEVNTKRVVISCCGELVKYEGTKFLIVEDDHYLREAIVDILVLYGVNVTEASSGNEAISIIQQKKFDVIISDLRMPNGDGKKLFRAIQDLYLNMQRPILIACSGYNDMNKEEAEAFSIFRVLTKPFSINELLIALEEVLQSNQLSA